MTEMKPVAWAHEWGAIWRDDNRPSKADFSEPGWTPLFTATQLEAARAEERERCAKAVDLLQEPGPVSDVKIFRADPALAIRSLPSTGGADHG